MSVFQRLFEGRKADGLKIVKASRHKALQVPMVVGARAALAYNATKPSNPVDLSKKDHGLLGTGSFGSVFSTKKPGTVVKLGDLRSELALLDNLPKRILDHPSTYKHFGRSKLSVPPLRHQVPGDDEVGDIEALEREDLEDLDISYPHGRERSVSNRILNLQRTLKDAIPKFSAPKSDKDKTVQAEYKRKLELLSRTKKALLINTLKKWHLDNQADSDMSDFDKKRLKGLASGLLRHLHHGIDLKDDLSTKNVGIRPDGSLVLRDIGVYEILPDNGKAEFMRIKPRNRITKQRPVLANVRKLKSLRSRNSRSYEG
jgi:hypothetical protein